MDGINKNTNNIYAIHSSLAFLKKETDTPYFTFNIKDFVVKIFTYRILDQDTSGTDDNIIHHDVVDVYLYEKCRIKNPSELFYISLEQDPRFCSYNLIKYKSLPGYSTGTEMPVITLCELIRYLHRLSNLAVFA